MIRAEIGGWSRDGIVRQASFAHEAPEVDPASVERQDAVGPDAAARALARAAVAQPSRRTTVARSGRGTAAAAPAGTAIGAGDPEEIAALEAMPVPRRALGDRGSRGGADQPRQGARPGYRILATFSAGARGGSEADADSAPVTKRDLVRYLVLVAPVLLPHLAGRALNLARYPDGVEGEYFWQKGVAAGTPDWITRWREPDPPDRRPHAYVVADSIATLAWLGNQAALEIHPWTSRIEAPGEPRWALVDIDPGERTTWDETLAIARLYRPRPGAPRGDRRSEGDRQARDPGVRSRCAPATRTRDASLGGADLPRRRRGRSRPGQLGVVKGPAGRARTPGLHPELANRTLVAPYSPRPAPGLPVSAPITWDELDDPALRPDRWTIRTILPRLAARGDLFAAALRPGPGAARALIAPAGPVGPAGDGPRPAARGRCRRWDRWPPSPCPPALPPPIPRGETGPMQDHGSLVAVLNSTWFASGLEPAVQTRLAELSRTFSAEPGPGAVPGRR